MAHAGAKTRTEPERARCANGVTWNENGNFLLTCTVHDSKDLFISIFNFMYAKQVPRTGVGAFPGHYDNVRPLGFC
jgi:hypothetical protein